MLTHPITRIAPHGVDALFLATGITLAMMLQQFPDPQPWLIAKIVGLVAYVVAGSMALKRARHYRQRAGWFVVALVCFAYIVSVALTRHVLGFLAVLGPG